MLEHSGVCIVVESKPHKHSQPRFRALCNVPFVLCLLYAVPGSFALLQKQAMVPVSYRNIDYRNRPWCRLILVTGHGASWL